MTNINLDGLSESVMNIVTDFNDEYEATASLDHGVRCAQLAPGSPVPKQGSIELKDNQRHIENYAWGARSKIAEICEEARTRVRDTMCIPPSDEALRMMEAFSLRKGKMSEAEIQALSDKYGNNYQVRKFIAEHAPQSIYGPEEDEADAALRKIDRIQSVGERETSASRLRTCELSKAARLVIAKEEMTGEGIFGAL